MLMQFLLMFSGSCLAMSGAALCSSGDASGAIMVGCGVLVACTGAARRR
jgi:hypothetical protein